MQLLKNMKVNEKIDFNKEWQYIIDQYGYNKYLKDKV